MGGDGGSIPLRIDLVKTKVEASRPQESNIYVKTRWSCCSLSSNKLSPPIVCDMLGNLYNKLNLIEYLLEKNPIPSISYIHSLKNTLTLKTQNSNFHKESKINDDLFHPIFVCPITLLEADGFHRFVAVRHCGCVYTERAIKEIPSQNCLMCNTPFPTVDQVIVPETNLNIARYIPINSTYESEEKFLRAYMDEHPVEKNEKKKKKDQNEPPKKKMKVFNNIDQMVNEANESLSKSKQSLKVLDGILKKSEKKSSKFQNPNLCGRYTN